MDTNQATDEQREATGVRKHGCTQRQPTLGLIVLALGGLLLLTVGWAATLRGSSTTFAATAGQSQRIQNIVLVHGAWADGSGWKGVYDILVKDGFDVSIVQEPETSFKEDVAATKPMIRQQDGKCILVAHSYGGSVATEAGTDSSVAGLAYVAAHAGCGRE